MRRAPILVSALTVIAMSPGCGGPSAETHEPEEPAGPVEQPPMTFQGDDGLPITASNADADDAPEEPAEPEAPEPRILRVTVVSAEVEGKMRNGEHWDARERPASSNGSAPLSRYLEQHPELADTTDTIGIPVDAEALAERVQDSPAADPMVFVEVGDRVFRSGVEARALNPVWNFSFVVLFGEAHGRQGVTGNTVVRLHVVDFDGASAHETIGTTLLTVRELMGGRVHRIEPFGSVSALTLQVESRPVPDDPEPRVERLAVPGHPSWTYTDIELVAGQRVRIEAADEVCSAGSNIRYCSGPEGQSAPHEKNLPGFSTLGHGALVGAVGDTRFAIGRSLSFVAPASGRLRLGVNDRDSRNNRGSYAVRVIVDPLP